MSRRWTASAAIVALATVAAPAGAQGLDTTIDVQNFRPSPGPGNYLGVQGSDVAPHLQIAFAMEFNFQWKPLVFEQADGSVSDAVKYQATMDFLWAIGLFNIIQLGVALPAVIAQDGDALSAVGGGGKLSTTAIRDLRFHLKGRLLGGGPKGTEKDGPGLAIALGLSVPTGNDESFSGDRNVTVDPMLVFDYRIKFFKFSINAGARIREMSVVADFQLGHELLYGLGVDFMLVQKRLQLIAEFEGAFLLNGKTKLEKRVPMEARAGIGWAFGKGKDLHLILGGGMGFGAAPTVPEFRILAALRYTPLNLDSDGDGVVDRQDLCVEEAEDKDGFDDSDGCADPDNDEDGLEDGEDACGDQAEDLDGFEDGDGCPESDNDGDGIDDAADECPDAAEDLDQFDDEDGCPDDDNDADGVSDASDKCTLEVEDADGYEDGDGCPDVDNDGDGMPDDTDSCPTEAEDTDGFADEDGCPERDNDMDGVPDATDACPDEAEILNGVKDEDGCPDKGSALVIIEKDQIKITQQINFKKNSAEITGKKSFETLDVVAAILLANTNLRIEVQGHTDSTGDRDHNIELSKARAESVVAYLVGKGVAADRLTSVGFGPDKPIADNATKAGKDANRRVEFHVITGAAQAAPAAPAEPANPAAPDASTAE